MFAFCKVHIVIMVLGFSIMSCAQDSLGISNLDTPENLQEQRVVENSLQEACWATPNRRIAVSWNVPALATAMVAGTTGCFINLITLRGSVHAMRRDIRTVKQCDISSFVVPAQVDAGIQGIAQFDIQAWKNAIDPKLRRLSRHGEYSILRRTLVFKVFAFGAPAYVAYHTVAGNTKLKSFVSGYLVQIEDVLR